MSPHRSERASGNRRGCGVTSGHGPRARTQRQRLPRQRGAHADRQVRRGPGVRPGRGAGRGRDPGRGRAGGARARRADRRGVHGPGAAGRRRSGARAPGAAAGRPRRHDPRHDDQPGLRVRPQVDHARRRGHPGGGWRPVRRGRHGVDERGPVPAAQGALRLPAGRGDDGRLRRDRRPVVRGRGLPHGHPRGAGRHPRPREPRGPGRVRAREPPPRGRRAGRGAVRRGARARRDPRREGPRDAGVRRRGAPARHVARGAREAARRCSTCRRARTAATRRSGP